MLYSRGGDFAVTVIPPVVLVGIVHCRPDIAGKVAPQRDGGTFSLAKMPSGQGQRQARTSTPPAVVLFHPDGSDNHALRFQSHFRLFFHRC